jgi:hypothetical protein
VASTVFVNAVTLTGAGWFQDVDNVAYQYLSGVAGTNTITATGPAGLGAYAAGLKFRFIPAATNTGATTINITGTAALGARNIFSGGVALTGGELTTGFPVEITDDGTQFNITSLTTSHLAWTASVGGTATYTGSQQGTWYRVGPLVYTTLSLTINLIGTGSTTVISGLFPAVNGTPLFTCRATGSATNIVSIVAQATGTTISLYSRTVASASDALNPIFQNGTTVQLSGVYVAA